MNCSPTATDMCTMDSSLWEWVGGKGLSTVSEWNLVGGDEYKRGPAQSVFFIGGFLVSTEHFFLTPPRALIIESP